MQPDFSPFDQVKIKSKSKERLPIRSNRSNTFRKIDPSFEKLLLQTFLKKTQKLVTAPIQRQNNQNGHSSQAMSPQTEQKTPTKTNQVELPTQAVQQMFQEVAALQQQQLQNPNSMLTCAPSLPVDSQPPITSSGKVTLPEQPLLPKVAPLLNVPTPVAPFLGAPALIYQNSQDNTDSGAVRIARLMVASQFMHAVRTVSFVLKLFDEYFLFKCCPVLSLLFKTPFFLYIH